MILPFRESTSTKETIIFILSEEWSLSAKEIVARVNKNSKKPITYQAVHKVLLQLCNEKVLEKNKGRYKLSGHWIENIRKFISSVEKKYAARKNFLDELATFKNYFEFTFDNVTDFTLSMAEMLVSERFSRVKGGYRTCALRHGWWPPIFSFDQFLILRKICKVHSKPTCVIRKDSPFGRWLKKQYDLVGFRTKIVDGLKDNNDDIIVAGPMILQVTYSKETKNAIDLLYQKTNGLSTLFKEYVISTFPKTKINIKVSISENQALATMLGKHYFEIWKNS